MKTLGIFCCGSTDSLLKKGHGFPRFGEFATGGNDVVSIGQTWNQPLEPKSLEVWTICLACFSYGFFVDDF